MNRREFVKTGLAATAALGGLPKVLLGEVPGSAEEKPAVGAEPRISGSFFDLIHPNWFDAA